MIGKATLAVLIACHDRKAKTLACLDSLVRQDADVAVHVILFDDGCSDGTPAAVKAAYPEVEILTGSGHAFWSGGMRAAFDRALLRDADFYLWLNDDVVLEYDALGRLLETHDTLARAGQSLCVIGGAVADAIQGQTSYGGVGRFARSRPLRFVPLGPDPAKPRPCDTLVGNVVLIPRDAAKTIGSIDPVFRHTLGDLDYGLRVAAAGGWVGLAPGHVGQCAPNATGGRWFNTDLPLRKRWRLLNHPLGFPLRPWLHFAYRHGGPLWPVFALLPFWRLFIPLALARHIDRGRSKTNRQVAGRPHARLG